MGSIIEMFMRQWRDGKRRTDDCHRNRRHRKEKKAGRIWQVRDNDAQCGYRKHKERNSQFFSDVRRKMESLIATSQRSMVEQLEWMLNESSRRLMDSVGSQLKEMSTAIEQDRSENEEFKKMDERLSTMEQKISTMEDPAGRVGRGKHNTSKTSKDARRPKHR